MKKIALYDTGSRRRAYTLAVLIIVNLLCAMFFLSDVVRDFEALKSGEQLHLIVEALASAALLFTSIFLSIELKKLIERNAAMAVGISAARGEMNLLMQQFFTQWGLSDAERDVALFVIKGLDNDAIATIRGTAAGTVRAQCASIYSKAGVEGRPHLISIFMEELLGEPLVSNAGAKA
jgi:DNA-binding CsgD family transcriptional regulator